MCKFASMVTAQMLGLEICSVQCAHPLRFNTTPNAHRRPVLTCSRGAVTKLPCSSMECCCSDCCCCPPAPSHNDSILIQEQLPCSRNHCSAHHIMNGHQLIWSWVWVPIIPTAAKRSVRGPPVPDTPDTVADPPSGGCHHGLHHSHHQLQEATSCQGQLWPMSQTSAMVLCA
jgi:hypothetical protein